jgi:hypothetical protein
MAYVVAHGTGPLQFPVSGADLWFNRRDETA